MAIHIKSLIIGALAALIALPAAAQDDDEQEQMIVVTGSRVTQGGMQDIKHVRDVILTEVTIPSGASLTSEGLMSEYDLYLTPPSPCPQTFCVTGLYVETDLMSGPYVTGVMALSFDSNISMDGWAREPLNLIAVVDKSGSMNGEPLDHVRAALSAAVDHMRPGDQLSIVLYGSTIEVFLEPTLVTDESRPALLQRISEIESRGSTNMEAGLTLGYDLARQTQAQFDGNTRLILFTDEQPNVGATHPESFMGMAEAAAREGIGLTTIGIGLHFGGELGARVSSVNGGNLFFITDEDDVQKLFEEEFDFMVTQVASDLTLTVSPPPGMEFLRAYGVPRDTFKMNDDGSITMEIASVFLSSDSGAVFLTLDGNPAVPGDYGTSTVTYTDLLSGQSGRFDAPVSASSGLPQPNFVKGLILISEYEALKEIFETYHSTGDAEEALDVLEDFEDSLWESRDSFTPEMRALYKPVFAELEPEYRLWQGLRKNLTHFIEHPEEISSQISLEGEWTVVSSTGEEAWFRPGDRLDFRATDELLIRRVMPDGYLTTGPAEYVLDLWDDEPRVNIMAYDYELDENLGYRITGTGDERVLTLTGENVGWVLTLEKLKASDLYFRPATEDPAPAVNYHPDADPRFVGVWRVAEFADDPAVVGSVIYFFPDAWGVSMDTDGYIEAGQYSVPSETVLDSDGEEFGFRFEGPDVLILMEYPDEPESFMRLERVTD